MNPIKGKLIVIEGTDGSGKETQSLKLRDRLWNEGLACEYQSFPRYDTPTGKIVKMYLGKAPFQQEFGPSIMVPPKIACTWYALDRQASAEEINNTLAKGIPVICNRYVESNMGHQGGKLKDSKERAEMISWLEKLEYDTLKVPRANLVVFLYMPYQVAKELREGRGGEKDGHEGSMNHLIDAEECYLELANRFGWKRIDCAPDGTRASLKSIEQIGDEVYGIVKRALQNT